jgi:hypothetical protein
MCGTAEYYFKTATFLLYPTCVELQEINQISLRAPKRLEMALVQWLKNNNMTLCVRLKA